MVPSDLHEAAEAIQREATRSRDCAERINARGRAGEVARGGAARLSRATRGDEDVLLCWQLGEDEIGYWHGTDEGFAARKPLPVTTVSAKERGTPVE